MAAALLLVAVIPIAGADHDEVRELRENEDIVGLEEILTTFRQKYPDGRVLEVELEREEDEHVYELEILAPSGEVRELRFDAVTGEFMGEDD
ncbi:peptidase YpeB-like protein [Halospina denitrificans]|uniref:Peptidase YpeB-like protein n=2 Tax=Halospina denitrificans TaxID=332522 RepID=A0A4R7JR44_9GAMM|nr:peptidase YpeB-like protein [Halospina denitrificans]